MVEDGESSVFVQLISKKPLPKTDLDVLQNFAGEQFTIMCIQSENEEPYWMSRVKRPFYRLPQFSLEIPFAINDFTQINPVINQKMIARACEWLSLSNRDIVADFFCGVGNFSLPIATCAERVVGFEMVNQMVVKGRSNALHNKLDNIVFETLDLFKQSLSSQVIFNKALLDPPRAGAEFLCRQLSELSLDCLVYVSCNPESFFRDAKILLAGGYSLEKMSLVDMFPQTAHIELIACFSKIRR
jgi:23S rRNA (uracil1939-C5)-methyltransferase